MQKPLAAGLLFCAMAVAQSTPQQVRRLLTPRLVSPDVAAYQLREYLLAKVPEPPPHTSASAWTERAARLRKHLLDDVVFHGWPREWVEAPPKFEEHGTIEGKGYRMHKLRYEIVPGFWSTAVLYEPENLRGTVPAILNVNGHVGAPGKAVEYKQKRCINQARQGILSLNLEWFSFGELRGKENEHWFGAHLDLVGANGVGLFYLAMRKGLDYLDRHPNVDRTRLGVTGLSGGGWQTIMLSALDERVAVSVPVAGYASLRSRLERAGDVGDVEQNPTDFLEGQDYTDLTAMRAPRPTLLIYNAEDDCCFRAPLVKPYIFDAVRPFFALYGKEENLAWHENRDPGTHNYQLDNRLQAYRFFSRHFGLSEVKEEIPAGSELRTVEELSAGLPTDNLTILGLARRMAEGLPRSAGSREQLRQVVRYRAATVRKAWAEDNSKDKGVESQSYRIDFDNGLSAAGVVAESIAGRRPAPATIILDDRGKQDAQSEVSERVNRGERVLAADLLLTGDMAPEKPGSFAYTQMLAAVGERPLGMEAAQLIGLARWLHAGAVRVETNGIRSQMAAQVAAALEPSLFREVVVQNGMASLRHLLEKPVEYQAAPDLFCLDLYKDFDIDRLRELAARQ
jgi:dienelactone hydrolase